MFTGIIESTGRVSKVETQGTNRTFWIESLISKELKIDQSISHNGVCLTVEEVKENIHRVTAIAETLDKTNLGHWQEGTEVNLERCMPMNGRLDGHIVQGHVDTTAILAEQKDMDGSWLLSFSFPEHFAALVIEKGSISINGISLTVFNVSKERLSVAIIPYTYEHTNLRFLSPGDTVNIEFDMIGKYVNRYLQLRG